MLRHAADSGHREELAVDDVEEVARREAIGGVEDVGLAPADELLAGVDGEGAVRDGLGQLAQRQARAPDAAIVEIEVPAIVHLIVRIGADLKSARELDPRRRLEEGLFARENTPPSTKPRCVSVCAVAGRVPAAMQAMSRAILPIPRVLPLLPVPTLTVCESPAA